MSTETPPTLSAAETEKAQALVNNEANDDEFQDAIEDEVDAQGNFPVTQEELSIIRAELACEFPEDYNYLSDAYILSVASKPYSKDPSIRRPLEYSMEKLTHVMEWRAEALAPEMVDMVKMANGPESAPEAVANPEKLAMAKGLTNSLNNGSMYWHGLDKEGRPILWIRTGRKSWYPDVDAEINALIAMADAGISNMPEGVTDFVVIADASYPPPPHATFLIKLLKSLVRGYPDRLHKITSAPVSSIIRFVMDLLLPLMPGRLASKVVLLDMDGMKDKLPGILLNGENDIPNFFGGPVDHDKLYPEESYSQNQGQGTLKFDFFGMVERLEKEKTAFENAKKGSS